VFALPATHAQAARYPSRAVGAIAVAADRRIRSVRFADHGAQNSPGHRQLAAQRSEIERRTGERCVTISSQRIATGRVAERDTR
jgi:hypothetical protein